MKQKLLFTFALLLMAVTGAWALTPQSGDVWNESTKTLTVNSNPGEGAYYSGTEIEHVVISAGVTTIGDNAFGQCTNLASVTFATGSQLETIGQGAFGNCKLTSVTIPDGVTTIDNAAFMSCSNLTSVTFGSGVETIGAGAFDRTGLTSITIPASVTSIGNGVLAGCSKLETITVATGNAKYDSRNSCNAIIDKSNNTLLAGCKSTTIPDGVTSIDAVVFFGCSGLTSIAIPASVTNIGFSAFANCSNLASVTFAAGSKLTSIGEQAFICCSGLTSIEIPANVETIGDLAFQECTNLASVTFAADSKLTSIGKQAFLDCRSLTSIAIPAGVTSVSRSTFYDCTSLATFTIYAPSCTLGETVFDNCGNLAKIYVPSAKVNDYKVAAGWSDYASIIQAAWVQPGDDWDEGTKTLTVNSNPGNEAYLGKLVIQHVVISAGVTSIGNEAFADCTKLASVDFATGSQLTTIGDEAFTNCYNAGLTSIEIPASVTSIGMGAFQGCSKLATITLNSNPFIGTNAFAFIADAATVTMSLTANSADGYNWMTFSNYNYNFQADANTQVFAAGYNNLTGKLALDEVTDKIIPSKNGVILKSTGNPVMTLTTEDGSYNYSKNVLNYVDPYGTAVVGNGSIYVLNSTVENGVGFYKLATGKTLGVGKAYLNYGAGARDFFGFDETTGIENVQRSMINGQSDAIYNLSGQRVMNPTKGLYIVNGKKVVLK